MEAKRSDGGAHDPANGASSSPRLSTDGEVRGPGDDKDLVMCTDPSGRYLKYNELLGEGAFKKVYKALDEQEGREVAWNEIQVQGRVFSAEERARLQAEIEIGTELEHPHIITFYESWVDEETQNLVFITELFTSGTLRQYRRKYTKLDVKAIKRWSIQILEGLAYLHEEHDPPIIHRDLKCDNIFINGHNGEVKIGDLGLATLLRQAKPGMSVLGTPEFMAPEMYEEQYDELVDIYAFGMCLLELVTCQFPYKECENAAQIYRKVSKGIGPQGLDQVQEQNPSMYDFIQKCLAKRESRPSARQLLEDPFLRCPLESVPHSRRDTKESLYSEYTSPQSTDDLSVAVDPVRHMQNFLESQTSLDRVSQGATTPERVVSHGLHDSAMVYQSKIVKTVSEKQFGSEFTVSGQENSDGTIEIKVRMPVRTDPEKKARNISFQYDPERDTAKKVAEEMAEEFSLGRMDERICAAAIQEAIHKAQGNANGSNAMRENGLEPSFLEEEVPPSPGRESPLKRGLQWESLVYPRAAMENPMMDHFKALLQNGEDSDVLIKSQGTDFKAHKVILSARSTVLKAMLKEPEFKSSGVLELDIPPEVMRVVLFYIYTGSLPLSASAEIHTEIDAMIKAADLLAMTRFKHYLKKFVNESKSSTS
ncbi:dual specificity protein kinase [Chloropicon primus]|uniref:non-specific serine/threonine protein kinase n=1 Tax=Chloropicon primus TaxID=1764295 RepID=A0A5B8MGA3_9CHLO|nr:dual specificity protein kinase [Chloropicon primus]UPQ98571.1 dual specificity protein kinase [Chloropicon primus]|eukprot:QDZ19361.1 dual specificity protein kinase [Chloropicon primus]